MPGSRHPHLQGYPVGFLVTSLLGPIWGIFDREPVELLTVTPKYTDDARHVAACTVSKIDYLVSWNFRHLVNVQRETGFNAVNLLQGYRTIRIVNPLELIYGNQDKDF